MIYNGYEVDPAFLEDGNIRWKRANNGEYIFASKTVGGRKTRFFIKRGDTLRYPDKSLPKATFDKYKAKADAAERAVKKIHAAFSGNDWTVTHAAPDIHVFWDADNRFVFVSPLIEGALPGSQSYAALSVAQFTELARWCAKALQETHRRGVIHGDIKDSNFTVVKTSGGRYESYLIDFDGAYCTTDIPEGLDIGGTVGFQSPETWIYGETEDMPACGITPKCDIFSLAVAFHKMYTGMHPASEAKNMTVSQAVYEGKKIILDPKFDAKIGPRCNANLYSLLTWMMAKDPAKRPTAEEVVKVLSDEIDVPTEFGGASTDAIVCELWQEHNQAVKTPTEDELKAKGVKSFRRDSSSPVGNRRYLIKLADGKERSCTLSELCNEGYLQRRTMNLSDPWPEDGIEFASSDTLAAARVAKIDPVMVGVKKRYRLVMEDGLTRIASANDLINCGFATKKSASGAGTGLTLDAPWPEHGNFDRERLKSAGIARVIRVNVGGEHRYTIEFADPSRPGLENVSGMNMKIMGYIK